MPTPNDLVQGGFLEKIDVDLDVDELPQRVLYAYPQVVTWLSDTLPGLVVDGHFPSAATPLEQADALFYNYVIGRKITQMAPHSMRPKEPGVWELRTHDLRFFGWFYRKGVFIISAADTKRNCKDGALYDAYRDNAINYRDALDLDPPPKFITGATSHVL